MKAKLSLYVTAIVLIAILTVGVGCTKAPNDAQLTSDIQNKLACRFRPAGQATGRESRRRNRDPDRHRGQRRVNAKPRPAMLLPSPGSSRSSIICRWPLHRQSETAAQLPPPPVEEAKPSPAPAPKPRRREPREREPARLLQRHNSGCSGGCDDAPPAPVAAVPSTPPPPPPPKKVTIPSGTTLAVRLVDTIDSETSQQGQTFHATLDSPLAVDGDVVIPSGYRR